MADRDSRSTTQRFDDPAFSSVEYHAPSETYRTEFDISTRSVPVAVIDALAAARGCDPLELPPLQQSIDTDALNSVFAKSVSRPSGTRVTVTFVYAGHLVTVNSHGTVEVETAEPAYPDGRART